MSRRFCRATFCRSKPGLCRATRVCPTKTDLPDKGTPPRTVARQRRRQRRDKTTERRGWIEVRQTRHKEPKRYAYRRRWERAESGWVRSQKQTRVKSIPPLSEEDYVEAVIANEGRNQTTGRKAP